MIDVTLFGCELYMQIPRKLVLLEVMPRNAMGKVNKKELVKVFDTNVQ